MAGIDYNKLYKLQDKVLAIVFETEIFFYLTGGTCLSRFYIEKRYSDAEELLINEGSNQENIWGANLYPYKSGDERLEYTSLINLSLIHI